MVGETPQGFAQSHGEGDMTRAKIFRLMCAVGSFGSLVAVVGAGTKWSWA